MKAIYISAREGDSRDHLAQRPIAEVMSKPVITVSMNALLEDALIQMVKTGVRHLAVVDDQGRYLGMLSDRAIASAWASDYDALSHRYVTAALDFQPSKLDYRCTVVDAARLMRKAGVDAVAVVDSSRRPIGIVTGSDLVCLLAK